MIPFMLDFEYERQPRATWALLAANTVLLSLTYWRNGALLEHLMFWPDRFAPWQSLTSMFLHADLMHLLGNMLFLWVFGRYIEERLGPWRMVSVYLGLGFMADLAYLLVHLGQPHPSLGASGAISGLLGLVVVTSPRLEVHCLWLHYSIRYFKLPTWFMLGFWAMQEIFTAVVVGDREVAVSAHLGGFFAGCALGLLLRSDGVRHSPWYMDPKSGELAELQLRGRLEGELFLARTLASSGGVAGDDRSLVPRARPVAPRGPTQEIEDLSTTYDGPLSFVDDGSKPPQSPRRRNS
ncbi:rhomboid family intramembrane serine protease [bacterium]|nr:MAG: rhomboid family intramembrane serine protease [bacterium]RIK65692.1 MAG: hypothetical protein DCC64_00830 [Planctomycetota bacterium]